MARLSEVLGETRGDGFEECEATIEAALALPNMAPSQRSYLRLLRLLNMAAIEGANAEKNQHGMDKPVVLSCAAKAAGSVVALLAANVLSENGLKGRASDEVLRTLCEGYQETLGLCLASDGEPPPRRVAVKR